MRVQNIQKIRVSGLVVAAILNRAYFKKSVGYRDQIIISVNFIKL